MQKTILSTFFIMLSLIALTQSNFEIKKIGDQYSTEQITSVFNSVDFCGSYFETKRNLITLNDGSEIELKSKSELDAIGIILETNCFLNDSVVYHSAIWSINDSNMLMKGSKSDINFTEKKMRVSNIIGQ
jgi:hypothetical protein